ncbi:hypothetical protein FA95DRAFT_1559410 [Auriscalpium vulgare]|uniref:Uncharacterized protein n=1 Tax=Auriscalpium vulgare TaxID=40419 RepID=A0ACB8RS87_9AGAM|nr:hypothetical protein FA95DRAFT_1559410 [Auriscalpium vulgare]
MAAPPRSLPPRLPQPRRGLKRPRGLWRARQRPAAYVHHQPRLHDSHEDSDGDSDLLDEDEDDEARSFASGSSKRQRTDTPDRVGFWLLATLPQADSTPSDSPHPQNHDPSPPPTLPAMIHTTTLAQRASSGSAFCDRSDWGNLKNLYAHAAELYERDDSHAASAQLRGVIHECHRFILQYADPSVLFAASASSRHEGSSPETLTPPEERLTRDWESDRGRRRSKSPRRGKHRRDAQSSGSADLPTALHAVLGTSLFLFGNLVAQDLSLLLQGEPASPVPYWLAALDVFETGENLPGRTSGRFGDTEDWRMAVVWGRTLVCLADEKISLMARADSSPSRLSPAPEPKWPLNSPFHTIAARRPPVTRRTSLATATPNDLMVLAMDQFSRGIFHMPHPQYSHTSSPIFARASLPNVTLPQALGPASADALGFSRPKELFTIASEVLGVAERLRKPEERRYWAAWADSVFNQMKMEADTAEWRIRITGARGRCWLISGSANVDDIEDALEAGDSSVLLTKDAEEARDGLMKAISFFDRAKGWAFAASSEGDLHELQPLLTEALLSLANLTVDDAQREELYSRAQAEGGDSVVLAMDSKSETASDPGNNEQIIYMDES